MGEKATEIVLRKKGVARKGRRTSQTLGGNRKEKENNKEQNRNHR
jgi:hypothetical protein